MNFGGLLGRAVWLRRQKPTQTCERCGLHYVPEEHEQCPHCGSLSETGLQQLKAQIAREQLGSRRVGVWFAGAALVILFVLLLISSR